MAAPKRVDWVAAEEEYVTTPPPGLTLVDIAKRYGVTLRMVAIISSREKWVIKRKDFFFKIYEDRRKNAAVENLHLINEHLRVLRYARGKILEGIQAGNMKKPTIAELVKVMTAESKLLGVMGERSHVDRETLWLYMVQRARQVFPETIAIDTVAEEFARDLRVPIVYVSIAARQLLDEKSVPVGNELLRVRGEFSALPWENLPESEEEVDTDSKSEEDG